MDKSNFSADFFSFARECPSDQLKNLVLTNQTKNSNLEVLAELCAESLFFVTPRSSQVFLVPDVEKALLPFHLPLPDVPLHRLLFGPSTPAAAPTPETQADQRPPTLEEFHPFKQKSAQTFSGHVKL